jgi:hypothetical protein
MVELTRGFIRIGWITIGSLEHGVFLGIHDAARAVGV